VTLSDFLEVCQVLCKLGHNVPHSTVETSVRHQDMAIGIEPEKVTKGLDGDDRAGDWVPFRYRLLQIFFRV
jgi:hypothetical protein